MNHVKILHNYIKNLNIFNLIIMKLKKIYISILFNINNFTNKIINNKIIVYN